MGTAPNTKNFNALQELYKHFRECSEQFAAALNKLVAPSELSVRRRQAAAERKEAEKCLQKQKEENERQEQEMARLAAAEANNREINPDDQDEHYVPDAEEIQKPNLGEPSESNLFSNFFSVFF